MDADPADGAPHDEVRMNRRRAFTIVELLVVISIIALLIGLLLPAVSGANAQSKTLQCMSNLRQLYLAAEQYSEASGGYYPIAYYSSFNSPLSISVNWDFTVTTNILTGAVTSTPGLLWPGSVSIPVQQCPVYDGPANAIGNPYTGYNYNCSYIGGGKAGTLVCRPLKAVQIHWPSRCAMFGDGQYYNGADKFMRAPYPGPDDLFFGFSSFSSGTQGFRHRGKTNVAFCDGHAETLSTCFTQTADHTPVGPGTGFLSADNSMYDQE
jgi:prepilin-type processing-associated H-X9-DG protein/prepilin-type N-terminal cleavage/methylation domain-containing protein